MKKPPVNLSEKNKDFAVYLPAISTFYNAYVSKQRLDPNFVPPSRIPDGFDRGIEGMNFLNEEEGYFTYNKALYSAGHAQLDITKSDIQESMIQKRDKNKTVIVGDSGGFQWGKGIIKINWHEFEGEETNKIREQTLNWLEHTADWSMMLDVPTWACDKNHTEKTGLKTVEDCLEKTQYNNDYFLTHRQGKTKFLNVLQGSDWESAEAWYKGVKKYSDPNGPYKGREAEGWAMGGANMCKMEVTLKRIMTLRHDKLLENKDWMHFLGTAQLDWSCYLTLIQRQIRKHINPNITISFDCASPFVATAHGLVYSDAKHTPKRWSIIMEKAPDNKALAGSDIDFPFQSEIGSRLKMGDVCYYAPGMLNKIGKEGKTSWDSFSYALYMAHNVNVHINAVQKAQQLMDIELAKTQGKINWHQWKKMKQSDMSDEYSEWVPRNVLYFASFIEELFNTKNKKEAFALIKQGLHFLRDLDGSRLRGGNSLNTFSSLFDIDQAANSNDINFEDSDDDALKDLENDILN